MPLEPISKMIARAEERDYAVGYFESWNLESLQGVVDAAERADAPVIIGFSGEHLTYPDRLAAERLECYAALGRAAAESAAVPCGLIFNECPRFDWVRRAVTAGFNLVMPIAAGPVDADFVRQTSELTRYAHEHGVAVEAEFGELPHAAADGEIEPGEATDPQAAAEFLRATGVDLLAVSIGNVHVLLGGQQQLDLERLAALREMVPAALVLHGGTGIAGESLRQAVAGGVVKVNFGTGLKDRYLAAVRAALGTDQNDPHRLLGFGGQEDVMVAGRLAVRDAVLEKMDFLGCCGKA